MVMFRVASSLPIEMLTTERVGPAVANRLRTIIGIATAVRASGQSGSRLGTSDVLAIPDVETANNTTLVSVRATQLSLEHEN